MEDNPQEETIELPELPSECSYDSETKLKTVIDGDLKVCNMVVAYHLEGWKRVKSVRDILALSSSTMEILKTRRQLMLKPESYEQVLKKKMLLLRQSAPKLGAGADKQLTYEPLE